MNLQLMVTSLLLAGIVITNCERERRLSAEVEASRHQVVEITAAYKQRLLDQQEQYEALQEQSTLRLSELSDLRADAARLRAELSAANARAATLSHGQGRPEPPADNSGERLAAMGTALEEATALISERDQCAVDYNALRAQCLGGNHGSVDRNSAKKAH